MREKGMVVFFNYGSSSSIGTKGSSMTEALVSEEDGCGCVAGVGELF